MNLRTDDIQGARPRIRHAPRNLIREQKQYQNLQYGREPNYIKDIHLSESYHERSPPLGPRNNQRVQMYQQYQAKYQGDSGDRMNQYQEPDPKPATHKYIMPKDAPVVNYDQYSNTVPANLPEQHPQRRQNWQAMEREREYFAGDHHDKYYERRHYQGNHMYERDPYARRDTPYQIPPEQKYYEAPMERKSSSSNRQVQKPQKQGSEREQRGERRSSSRRSANSQDSRKREGTPPVEGPKQNIFRGLGYNIITNSKFSYDMENTQKNTTSKWL